MFYSFYNTGDEFSCYFLAECIRNGKLWSIPHPLHQFFEVVHVGNKDGKWFSVYPPGWPLIYALALTLRIGDFINPILAVIAVIFFFKIIKQVFGFREAVFAVLIFSTTPFFLFTNAAYFSHTTCFLMVVLFLYAYQKWREKKSVTWAGLVALTTGFGLHTRYLTMFGMIVPFLLYELSRLIQKKEKPLRSYFAFGFIFAIMLFSSFYCNYLITGNFFNAPNHYLHRWERLGFHYDYTLFDGLNYIWARMWYLMDWSAPAILVFYLLSLFRKRNYNAQQKLYQFSFFYLVGVYIFYYSWGGGQFGPRYYFEAFPLLAGALSASVFEWWKKGADMRRKFIVGTILVSLSANAYLLMKHGFFYNSVSRQRKDLYVLAEHAVKRPAIVFIKGFLGDTLVMAEEDAVRNHPNLKADILYVHDLDEKNRELKAYYPDWHYYHGHYDRTLKAAQLDSVE